MKPNQSTMLQLGYLGLLPFVDGLLLIITNSTVLGVTGQQIFVTYSAVILSFLSGILWGSAIDRFNDGRSRNALIFSNVFALMAWAALLFGDQQYIIPTLLLATGFIAVWFAEKDLRKTEGETTPSGYQAMRNRLTAAVVIMHGILLFL